MEYKLTKKYQLSKHCKDSKDRNFIIYFLNGVEILKQKVPFDTNFELGFDRRTVITDEYILNGQIHQTRYFREACGAEPKKIRNVSYPLSKKILKTFEIPVDFKITI